MSARGSSCQLSHARELLSTYLREVLLVITLEELLDMGEATAALYPQSRSWYLSRISVSRKKLQSSFTRGRHTKVYHYPRRRLVRLSPGPQFPRHSRKPACIDAVALALACLLFPLLWIFAQAAAS